MPEEPFPAGMEMDGISRRASGGGIKKSSRPKERRLGRDQFPRGSQAGSRRNDSSLR